MPFINDTKENIEGILDYCVKVGVHGIICFGMGVTLRDGDREYFYAALDKHFPGLKQKYQRTYGYAYEIASENNKELMKMFVDTCKRNDILYRPEDCFEYMKELPEKYEQLSFF